ncbi:MAG: UbiD family decarboxylase domain-containing protein, partial [Moorellaceae bacterium]
MKDLRTFIESWQERFPKDIITVEDEVDPKYQITAIVKSFDLAGLYPLLVFKRVKGYKIPVVCNVEATVEQLAFALGVQANELSTWYNAIEEQVLSGALRIPPVEIPASSAPVKETILRADQVDLYSFPFLTHHVGEVPYITRGIGITRDPESGLLHAAHYRLMVKSKNLMVTHITPGRHLWYILKKAEAMGKSLPIAFAVGNHPAWSIGAQSRIAHPPTEYDVIG